MYPFGNNCKKNNINALPHGNLHINLINNFNKLRLILILLLFLPTLVWAEDEIQPLRFGITPVITHDQNELIADWREYLQKKLKRPVEFVLRDSYRETIDLIKRKKIDFAWVSDYPYVYLEKMRAAKLLVIPLYHGRPYYASYLIVPSSDRNTKSLLQLKGKIFAYADPYSNSGYLVPRYQLQQAGEDPSHFFRKTFYTWGHEKIVNSVAQGLADGGMLDSFVWDTLASIQPELTNQTRIVAKSVEFGFPPIVVRSGMNTADTIAMQNALLGMAKDQEGRALLTRLNLSGFAPGNEKLYEVVRKMMHAMGDL